MVYVGNDSIDNTKINEFINGTEKCTLPLVSFPLFTKITSKINV